MNIKMKKEKDIKNELNNFEINVDRGLETLLEHDKKKFQEFEIFSIKIQIFKFKFSFDLKKMSQEKKLCKKHL